MEKKGSQNEDEKKREHHRRRCRNLDCEEEKPGLVNRMYVSLGQKVGVIEWTKLEPRFERNIDKLISYHNIIYRMVDAIELQIQIMPKVIAMKKVVSPPDENPWEVLGGWLNTMAVSQFTGSQAKILEKFSSACGKIAVREAQVQRRTRSNLIRKMRMYTGDESAELNENVDLLRNKLHMMVECRHDLKNSKTVKDVRAFGEEYRQIIRAFNECANEIQGWIDEVSMVVPLHQQEFLKFSREVSLFHDSVHNSLNEVFLRLGIGYQKLPSKLSPKPHD